MYSPFKQYKILPNFNNCSDIKGLRFVAKAISPWYCCFLHKKNTQEGRAFMRSRNPQIYLQITLHSTIKKSKEHFVNKKITICKSDICFSDFIVASGDQLINLKSGTYSD